MGARGAPGRQGNRGDAGTVGPPGPSGKQVSYGLSLTCRLGSGLTFPGPGITWDRGVA